MYQSVRYLESSLYIIALWLGQYHDPYLCCMDNAVYNHIGSLVRVLYVYDSLVP